MSHHNLTWNLDPCIVYNTTDNYQLDKNDPTIFDDNFIIR